MSVTRFVLAHTRGDQSALVLLEVRPQRAKLVAQAGGTVLGLQKLVLQPACLLRLSQNRPAVRPRAHV